MLASSAPGHADQHSHSHTDEPSHQYAWSCMEWSRTACRGFTDDEIWTRGLSTTVAWKLMSRQLRSQISDQSLLMHVRIRARMHTKQLMADVWLRRVHGPAVMSHILRRVECLESQAIEEITGMQQACNGPYLPSRLLPAQHKLVNTGLIVGQAFSVSSMPHECGPMLSPSRISCVTRLQHDAIM